MSALIVRRVGLLAPPLPTASGCWHDIDDDEGDVPRLSSDLRFFLTSWFGGVVFFGTLLG